MTADDELERVVAWLRREAEPLMVKDKGWPLRVRLRSAWLSFRKPSGMAGAGYEYAADALTRHEHRETNNG